MAQRQTCRNPTRPIRASGGPKVEFPGGPTRETPARSKLQAHPGPKPYKFIGFGDIHGPKVHEFIGFGDIHGPKNHRVWGHPYPGLGFEAGAQVYPGPGYAPEPGFEAGSRVQP